MSLYSTSTRRVRTHASTLEELRHVWGRAETAPLWWDSYNAVFVRERSPHPLRELFGRRSLRDSLSALRLLRLGSLQRWHGPVDLGLALPHDALVVQPYSKRGPVVISVSGDLALKIVHREGKDLKNEIDALLLAKEHGLHHHTQEIVSHGTSGSGAQWMTSRLAPNLRLKMSGRLPVLSRLWYRWLDEEGLPFLFTYYRASGVETTDYDDVRARAIDGLEHAPRADTERLVRLLSNLSPSRTTGTVLTARIHGDLDPAHVHFPKAGWKLIDWGESRRRELFYEFFRGFWNSFEDGDSVQLAFGDWLTGARPYQNTPYRLRRTITQCLHFHRSNFGLDLDAYDLRAHMLCVMVAECVESGGENKLRYLAERAGSQQA